MRMGEGEGEDKVRMRNRSYTLVLAVRSGGVCIEIVERYHVP